MKITNLYLQKNDKAAEEIKATGETKKPYFRLCIPPVKDEYGNTEGDWIEVGAFWRAKNGKGYNFKLKEHTSLDFKELTSADTEVPFED